MDDAHLRQILLALGLSWKGYRKVRKGTKRRLERFMQEHGFRSTDSFLSALAKHPDLGKQAQRIAAVSISRFFRDRGLWEVLGKQILPSLLASHPSVNKIWSAGCARGEEVYSIKILWEELGRASHPLPSLELWGTDMNEEFLARARAGVYSPSSLKEVKEEWRRRYFRPADPSGLAIVVSLKKEIRWEVHDLIAGEPPAKDFSLIFLRNNLLTYYREETKNLALGRILQSLQPGGVLVIGAHEKLPEEMEKSMPSVHHPSIYRKTGADET
jgi:chemotaxis protein methyltransferase CheR